MIIKIAHGICKVEVLPNHDVEYILKVISEVIVRIKNTYVGLEFMLLMI